MPRLYNSQVCYLDSSDSSVDDNQAIPVVTAKKMKCGDGAVAGPSNARASGKQVKKQIFNKKAIIPIVSNRAVEEIKSKRQTPGRKWRAYTDEEDIKILNFITDVRYRYLKTCGVELWTCAHKMKICPGRTAYSLKERWNKFIVNNIKKFNLDNKELESDIIKHARATPNEKREMSQKIFKNKSILIYPSGREEDPQRKNELSALDESDLIPETQETKKKQRVGIVIPESLEEKETPPSSPETELEKKVAAFIRETIDNFLTQTNPEETEHTETPGGAILGAPDEEVTIRETEHTEKLGGAILGAPDEEVAIRETEHTEKLGGAILGAPDEEVAIRGLEPHEATTETTHLVRTTGKENKFYQMSKYNINNLRGKVFEKQEIIKPKITSFKKSPKSRIDKNPIKNKIASIPELTVLTQTSSRPISINQNNPHASTLNNRVLESNDNSTSANITAQVDSAKLSNFYLCCELVTSLAADEKRKMYEILGKDISQ